MEREPSIAELKQKLDEKDRYIESLEATIDIMKVEQEEMIENFRRSTGALIERLKTEAEQRTGVRPQTAHLLAQSRPSESREPTSWVMGESSLMESTTSEAPKEVKRVKCHLCAKMFPETKLQNHMVKCYRKVKCKVCGEMLLKHEIQKHLTPFRDETGVKEAAIGGNFKKMDQCFAHGFNPDTRYSSIAESSSLKNEPSSSPYSCSF